MEAVSKLHSDPHPWCMAEQRLKDSAELQRICTSAPAVSTPDKTKAMLDVHQLSSSDSMQTSFT